jgi:rhodanese-related sulfurtransferase
VRGTILRQGFLLLVIAFLPAIGEALYFRDRIPWASPVPASELVQVETAKAWGSSALWVDARPDDQYAQGHFPNALPLNESGWDKQLRPVLEKWSEEKKIVVYCSTQSCGTSREIADRLRKQAQLKNVFVLDGGWEALRVSAK